jgi:hypothetical protein
MINLDCIKYDDIGQGSYSEFFIPHWSDNHQNFNKIINGSQFDNEGNKILYKNDLQG